MNRLPQNGEAQKDGSSILLEIEVRGDKIAIIFGGNPDAFLEGDINSATLTAMALLDATLVAKTDLSEKGRRDVVADTIRYLAHRQASEALTEEMRGGK